MALVHGQLAHQVPVKDYEGEGDCDGEVTWSLEEDEDNEKRREGEGNRGPCGLHAHQELMKGTEVEANVKVKATMKVVVT